MMLYFSMLLSAAIAGGVPVVPKAPPVVTVHAKEYAYVAPKTVKAGATTFRLVNDGKELHHLTLVKLAKGKTLAEFAESMKKPGPMPSWASPVGGPNPAAPGRAVEATVMLEPGDYVMFCVIPSPGETMPHAMKGMMAPLTVLPGKSSGAMPTGDVTVTLSDYKFAFSTPLTAGKHIITVTNAAAQPHELVMLKLNSGKTAAEFDTFVEKDLMKGAPPAMPVGGLSFMDKGRTASFPVDLTPGNYAMICFVPDAKDGKSHAVHGMITQFAVK